MAKCMNCGAEFMSMSVVNYGVCPRCQDIHKTAQLQEEQLRVQEQMAQAVAEGSRRQTAIAEEMAQEQHMRDDAPEALYHLKHERGCIESTVNELTAALNDLTAVATDNALRMLEDIRLFCSRVASLNSRHLLDFSQKEELSQLRAFCSYIRRDINASLPKLIALLAERQVSSDLQPLGRFEPATAAAFEADAVSFESTSKRVAQTLQTVDAFLNLACMTLGLLFFGSLAVACYIIVVYGDLNESVRDQKLMPAVLSCAFSAILFFVVMGIDAALQKAGNQLVMHLLARLQQKWKSFYPFEQYSRLLWMLRQVDWQSNEWVVKEGCIPDCEQRLKEQLLLHVP